MHDGDPRGQLRPAATGDGACTGCHRQLAGATAQAKHSHHLAARDTASGTGCVDCHMPRIVYGILDLHRSHRIEVPDPARAAVLGRPDACTACHVEETPAWAAAAVQRLWGRDGAVTKNGRGGSGAAGGAGDDPTNDAAGGAGDDAAGGEGPLAKILSGDPIERAVAADALGRSRVPAGPDARAVRVGRLLEVMAGDDYPAVRYLAARALGQLWPAPELASPLAGYDPNGAAGARQRAVAQLRASLPERAVAVPAPALVRRLRAAATEVAIEIGE
jgi:hypothetical protein